ncbi:double-strand break repair protein AddB [Niveispirillum irakense]|uniref:double-strand break repair protein AddB n=1 Tax=Niveispirillum irakense TaxID=34011 RepID=UPI00040EDD60|nr:double-strand break repair protein AddB [Niveispirillum irakense]
MPTIFTLPPNLSFVDALAAGLWVRAGGDALALSRFTILLPTARAGRSLREAFLRLSGGRPVLLPRMAPLGDVDADEVALMLEGLAGVAGGLDLPPAIGALRRQLLLSRAVLAAGDNFAKTKAQAARLGRELARLLDQAQTEGLDFDRLRTLVPEDYAEHWQVTLSFLSIIIDQWPAILGELGLVDPATERNNRLAAFAKALELNPPDHPVIAAGSTGTIPAAADLLATIARLPQGAVVLPGLDQDIDADTWAALDEAHPQFALKQLLGRLGVEREAVKPWPVPGTIRPASPAARTRLIAEAMRPAGTTEAWRDMEAIDPAALDGLHRIDATTPQEEAGIIALILREALEVPERTAALITPDRNLARRVATELRRWNISVDDSAGRPLAQTPVGSFLRVIADFAVQGAPIPLLSLLKHPLAGGGLAAGALRRLGRQLEKAVLRGPRPAAGLDGLRRALENASRRQLDNPALKADLLALVDRLDARLGAFVAAVQDGESRELIDWLRLHVGAAEAMAALEEEPGDERLWRDKDGEAAADFIDELRDAAAGYPLMGGRDYAGLMEVLVSGRPVRPAFGLHPRLHILGLMEARLQQFDVMVLAGLNEGTWPPAPPPDPWMSRPMRTRFGLPSPEQQVGQAAHDFAQATGARTLYLSRSERVDGTPTVPSRWLLRLDTVLAKAGRRGEIAVAAERYRAIHQALDRPARVRPCPAPAPTPPVTARPRRLSVTQIETWMRDPYAIYARKILDLEALEPIDADPGAAERGEILHKALELFIQRHPNHLPPNALSELLACGRQAFGDLLDQPGVQAFWWPRFERVAAWFLEAESARRPETKPLATEVTGSITLPAPGGDFILTAKADRIDRTATGGVVLVDYKTGQPPTGKEVRLGKAPQLPLEALIAEAGGFTGIGPAAVDGLEFWRLTGGDPAGTILRLRDDTAELAADARDGLLALIAAFDDPTMPYRSQPRPAWAPRFTDYAHLARIAEWSAGGGEEG